MLKTSTEVSLIVVFSINHILDQNRSDKDLNSNNNGRLKIISRESENYQVHF